MTLLQGHCSDVTLKLNLIRLSLLPEPDNSISVRHEGIVLDMSESMEYSDVVWDFVC